MQTLTESLVLSVLGSAVGLVIAHWGGLAIGRLLITGRGASLDVLTDWRTLGVAVGVAVACSCSRARCRSYCRSYSSWAPASSCGAFAT